MKPFKFILSLAIAVVANFGIMAADGSSDILSEANLRSLIVENPDSLLSLLDTVEAMRAPSLPQYKIDLYRGLAYNEKRMPTLVEKYSLKALADDSIDTNQKVKLNLLTMLSDARIVSGNYQGSIDAALQGIEVARKLENRPAEYNLLTSMAQVAFGMGDRAQGYRYIDGIIAAGAGSKSVRELANVSAAYGVKIVQLYADDRYDEALAESQKRLDIIKRIDEIGGAPEGFTDQQRAYTYARIASSAQQAGKTALAKDAFGEFMATTYGNTVVGRPYITDYLLESHQWQKVLDFTRPLYPLFEQGDSISTDFHSLLISNARAQAGLGNYREGYELMARANAVQDSLYYREKNSKAQELAAIFAMNEKELELTRTKADADRKHILLLAASGLAVAIFLILVIIWLQYRNSLRRNRIASRQIDEMNAQREIIHKQDAKREDENFALFARMERQLLDSKKYLEPDYNRDSLCAEFGDMPKSRVSQLIQQYTGLTLNDYINKLRVEHSVRLIQEHPEWTIDAIASASGYARKATFYSNFDKIYGLTPAQYRKQRESQSEGAQS